MARRYQQRKRADRQAETRRRIVEAAVDLHTTVGPSRTSVAAIAKRAGVQRHTVYAHFPDERALFGACSAHWRSQNPFPDVDPWAAIDDPEQRLRTALAEVYAWYERVEPAFALFVRDVTFLPIQAELMEQNAERTRGAAALLRRGLPRRRAVAAAIGHALEFETWRSLARRQGLTREQAVDAMARFVLGA
jgi:AcrR family transcriptional regulator